MTFPPGTSTAADVTLGGCQPSPWATVSTSYQGPARPSGTGETLLEDVQSEANGLLPGGNCAMTALRRTPLQVAEIGLNGCSTRRSRPGPARRGPARSCRDVGDLLISVLAT